MKKLLIGIFCVFAISAFSNTGNNVSNENKTEINIEDEEDFGCASDCVRSSRNAVMEAADEANQDVNSNPKYMTAYLALYSACYDGC
ncbi:hypothetical protein [Neotamlana laminarinivorans]|uniref:Uncharacterized protein n=1 Tax=Neotamlana laminarinivorans TaxID=2883124 RepID=A0A9X1HXN5_9FLAO|nr:hypothetical protein [Tamlana laminarinivorans]MCB4798053.1 hypothetical protein [Tamlana laminarinivorans]